MVGFTEDNFEIELKDGDKFNIKFCDVIFTEEDIIFGNAIKISKEIVYRITRITKGAIFENTFGAK